MLHWKVEKSLRRRFTNRKRCGNYTQIFTAAVEVSGTDLAAGQLGLADEMDYQKQERLRELIRDLENTVINGGSACEQSAGRRQRSSDDEGDNFTSADECF